MHTAILAITYHKLGDANKADAALSKLTEKQTACGDSCADKTKLSEAVAAVQKAMNGDQQALLKLPKAFANASDKAGDAIYLSAVGLINEERYEEALAELDKVGITFGPHPDVLTYIGFANRKMKRFSVAEDYYQRALAVTPNHLGAIEYYGELKVERGDLDGAKAHLAQLEELCAFGCYEAEELRRWIAKGPKLLGFLAAIAGFCGAVWAAEANPSIRAVSWLSKEGAFEALTTEPAVGFRIEGLFLDRSNEILTGEALFHTPSLLGGQAAKAGISCASCHVNGQGNPHFQFPGISGQPGTADATHNFFSSHRGDDKFNPVSHP